MQTALNQNNAAEAKQLLQQYFGYMEQEISSVDDDDSDHQNLMETMNLFKEKLQAVKPDKHCACDDIKQIIGGSILHGEFAAGFALDFVLGLIGSLSGGIRYSFDLALHRLKCGDISGTVTGLFVGLIYGSELDYVNSSFAGYRAVFDLLEGKQCKYSIAFFFK